MMLPRTLPSRGGRILALCVTLTACSQASHLQPAAISSDGIYEITIRERSTLLTGTLEVRGDSMSVRARDAQCLVDRTATDDQDQRVIFKCNVAYGVDAMTLSFDRRDPLGQSRWSGKVSGMTNRSECTAYGVDERGNRICTATRIVNTENTGTVSGSIIVKAIAP